MTERFKKHRWHSKIVSSEGYSIQIIGRDRIEYIDEAGTVEFSFEPSVYRGVDVMLFAREFLNVRDRDPDIVIDRFRRAFDAAHWRLRGFDEASLWLLLAPQHAPGSAMMLATGASRWRRTRFPTIRWEAAGAQPHTG